MTARAGDWWQIAIAIQIALVACKESGPMPPIPQPAEGDPLWDHRIRADIPQVPEIDALFDAVQPERYQTVRSALVLCRIDAVENPHTRDVVFLRDGKPVGPTNPDLTLGLTIGRRPMRIAKGVSNSWRSTVSFAGIDLDRGDRVRALVWDHDLLSNDEVIGEPSAIFAGSSPLVLRNDAVTVECRVVPDAVVAAHVFTSLRDADVALERLAAALAPDFHADSLGFPTRDRESVRRAISKAASYIGWNRADVRLRVAREQELGREWTRRVRARGDALVAELPAAGELVPVPQARASIGATLACTPDCALRLEIARDEPSEYYYPSGVKIRLLGRDGTSFAAREIGAEYAGRRVDRNGLPIERGEPLTVIFETSHTAAHAELAEVRLRKSPPILIRVK